jgi:hypothetical protein
MEVSRVYIYKLTVDDGGAPCIQGGMLSLAICKPAIRATACPDNIILGFAANSLYVNNCLVYAANVTRHLDAREYFSESRYATRADCIYRWDGQQFKWKKGAMYHSPDDVEHDLGVFPQYERANVLLSERSKNYRYFKDSGPIDYKRSYPLLTSLVERLGQGHRINFPTQLQMELRQFIERIWKLKSVVRRTLVPDVPCRDKCVSADEEFVRIDC